MPNEAIDISTSVDTIPQARDTFETLCIIGYSDSGTANDGDLEVIDSASDAENYFGSDSELTSALKDALNQGTTSLYGYNVPIEEQTDTIDAGSTETLSQDVTYINRDISISETTIYSTYDEPSTYSEDISSDEAIVNTNTNEIYIGGDSTDVTVTYYSVPWSEVFGDLEQTVLGDLSDHPEIGIVTVAGLNSNQDETDGETLDVEGVFSTDEAYQYGDKVNVKDLCDELRAIFIMSVYGYDDALTHTTDISELESKNIMATAHTVDTTSYDMSAMFAGAVSVVDETDKLMWKKVRNISDSDLAMGLFSKTQVDLLESDNVNALIKKDNKYVFSNGYSTSTDDTYKWIDIVRTRNVIEDLIKNYLDNMLMSERVPYTQSGFSKVKDTIKRACRRAVEIDAISSRYIDSNGEYVKGYRVIMPDIRNVSSEEREDRELNDVEVMAKIPGHIHTISINMTIYI